MGQDDLPAFPTPHDVFSDNNPPPQRRGYNQPPPAGFFPTPQPPGSGGGYGGPPPHNGHHNSYSSPSGNYNTVYFPPPAGGSRPSQPPYTGSEPHRHREERHASTGSRPSPEANLRNLFNGVDRNGNGALSETELGSALVNGDYSKFDRETVRLMIKMFDRNGDGAIEFDEFGNLWRYLRDWRKIFDKFDRNRSGTISFNEFARALDAFGYSLSDQCIQYMFSTYSHPDRYGDRIISFDMFVQACINLKRITDSFKKFDTDRDGYITLGFEHYLLEMLSLR